MDHRPWAATQLNNAGTTAGTAARRNFNPTGAIKFGPAGFVDLTSSTSTSNGILGINAGGTIVGWVGESDARAAVRWSSTNVRTTLSGFGYSSAAYAVNDAGTVVGSASRINAPNYVMPTAVRWDSNSTTAVALGQPFGLQFSVAQYINNTGTAPGIAVDGTNAYPVHWSASGSATTLTNLPVPAVFAGSTPIRS